MNEARFTQHLITQTTTGVLLSARAALRAAASRIDGHQTGADGRAHSALRVCAVPDKRGTHRAVTNQGASRDVCALIAAWLGVPKTTLAIERRTTGRAKTIAIRGDASALAMRVTAALTPPVSPAKDNAP